MSAPRILLAPWPLGVVFVALVGCGTSHEADGGKSGPARESTARSVEAERAAVAPPANAAAPPTKKPAPTNSDPGVAARLERVRRSLEQGLDVNKADVDGRTSLMMAAFDGYADVVALLLENGADVDLRDSAGRTAVMFASSGPFPGTVELLLQHGADVNDFDSAEGWTALMLAAAEGHQPVVELLLRYGADADATDQDGERAIDHARKRRQSHIVALLESGPG